jgi:outer membrane receptor for ferrienterochelin and colicins
VLLRLIAITLFSTPLGVLAQSPAATAISGRVIDPAGLAAPGVTVVLTNLVTRFERVTVTDERGTFAFASIADGRYRVLATLDGFAPVSADTDAGRAVELTLSPSAFSEQVTVISASRQEALRESLSTPVSVLTKDRLRDTARTTVGDALRELPGVLTRRGSEGAGIAGEQVQGIDSRQVLVLIDGQPIAGARGIKSGAINLDRQTTHRLDRVEVVKGAASALFGSDAIGGVINLIPRDVTRREGDVTLVAGAHGRRDLSAAFGAPVAGSSFFGSVSRAERDAFDLTPSTPDTTGAAFTRTDAFGRARVSVSPALRVTLTGSAYGNTERGRALSTAGVLQAIVVDDESVAGGAAAQWHAGPRTSLEARVYGTRFDESSSESPDTLYESLSKADVTFTQSIGGRQLLQVGVEASSNKYAGHNRVRAEEDGHAADTAVVWAQNRINAGSRLTFTVGGRYDRHSIFGSAFSPKAAVNARITDTVRARASYGEGFRAPDLGQLFYRFVPAASVYQVVGNPNLAPETARSWQIGADVAPAPRVRAGLNLFRNDVDNLIEAVSLGFLASPAQRAALLAREGIDSAFAPVLGRLLFHYRNVREVVTQGVEVDGQAELARGLQLAAAYTYLDAVDGEADAPLAGRHRHQGMARATWVSARFGLRAEMRGTFFSSWIATSGRGGSSPLEDAPAYALWDLYAAKRLAHGFELFGAVDNAANSQDSNTNVVLADGSPAPIYRPEIGRAVRVGLRWSTR